MMATNGSTLVFIVGPPAIGKMAVGHGRPDYLHVDNTLLPASAVAERIIETFGLRKIDTSASA
jgi:hypothetical protein